MVSEVTASSLINAFRRIIAVRGLVKRVYSDQGSKSVGALNAVLRKYLHEQRAEGRLTLCRAKF